ncbi:hypothetical protein GE09DRAFT_1126267 [Coniochaeta sp. 2T2.1]|nr:hypothetical protein GE09DRAFT_1126267 [Coniochaeta sp. 2T2.1]
MVRLNPRGTKTGRQLHSGRHLRTVSHYLLTLRTGSIVEDVVDPSNSMYYKFAILLLFQPFIKLRIIDSIVSPTDVCSQAADAIQALSRSYSIEKRTR